MRTPPTGNGSPAVAPCITLTTDFGTRDGYAGAMKGRLAVLAPGIPVVDISHDIAPQAILEGAWCLRRAAPRFPPGTVHVAVVDPEVGSWRSAVLVVTEHFFLVGPDNGLLSLAARDDGIRRVIEIRDTHPLWNKSASFDGLTLFAPVAAFLAKGGSPDEVGDEADDLVNLPEPALTRVGNALIGQILMVDHFGNCITSIHKMHVGSRLLDRVVVQTGLDARICGHYAELAGGSAPGALWNHDGFLELAVFGDSIAQRYGLKAGDPVRVLLKGLG